MLVVIIVGKLIDDLNRLASSCWTAEQDVHFILNVEMEEVVVSDTVNCWDQ